MTGSISYEETAQIIHANGEICSRDDCYYVLFVLT